MNTKKLVLLNSYLINNQLKLIIKSQWITRDLIMSY